MRRRQCDHWLDEYIKWTVNSESPVLYQKWAAITVVAAALQRRCWMAWGNDDIYPNLYVVLVGPSGGRKGDPVKRAKYLLEKISIPMLGNSSTKEAIIRDMKKFEMSGAEDGTTRIAYESPVACVTSEFYALMQDYNTQLAIDMTDWYDSLDTWKSRTKTQGDVDINGICLTLLSSSDPSWLKLIFTPAMLQGGFFARLVFVVQERSGRTIVNPNKVTIDKHLENKLLSDLEAIKTMKGRFTFDLDAEEAYEKWYEYNKKLEDEQRHPLQKTYIYGYVTRRATMIKKLCMITCAMRDNSRRISLEDFNKSLELMEEVEEHMPIVLKGLGTTKYGMETNLVLDYLKKHKKASQQELLQNLGAHIDAYNFQIVRDNLVMAGLATNDRVNGVIVLTFIGDKGS